MPKTFHTISRLMPERILLRQVMDLARFHGWFCWHDVDPRRNEAGFPDLLMLKAGRPPLWVELKREDGRVRPRQELFMALLRECGQDVRVWRPSNWPEVLETLGGERR